MTQLRDTLEGHLVDILGVTTEMSDQMSILAEVVHKAGMWESWESLFERHVELVKTQNKHLIALAEGLQKIDK